jgi:hypothetical protein
VTLRGHCGSGSRRADARLALLRAPIEAHAVGPLRRLAVAG